MGGWKLNRNKNWDGLFFLNRVIQKLNEGFWMILVGFVILVVSNFWESLTT